MYYSSRLDKVEGYIRELNSKVENLEQIHLRMSQFIRHEQPSTIVHQKLKRVEELSKANAIVNQGFTMAELALHAKGESESNNFV